MGKVLVLFYSTYGHVYNMALHVAEGVKKSGAEVVVKRVPETLSPEILQMLGAVEAQKQFEHIPVLENRNELAEYDGIIFGAPTRFGGVAAQFKNYIDSLGQLWVSGALSGKVAGVFTSTSTQHGGNETTILSFIPSLFHLGFIVAGIPPTYKGITGVETLKGGSPYGASTITGSSAERPISEDDKNAAIAQGEYIGSIANKLAKKDQI